LADCCEQCNERSGCVIDGGFLLLVHRLLSSEEGLVQRS